MGFPGSFFVRYTHLMTESDSNAKPPYQWRATFPDEADDFAGWNERMRFGRIMKHAFGRWEWPLIEMKLGSAVVD